MAPTDIVAENTSIDEILEPHRAALGPMFTGYRNHAYRMLNFIRHLVPPTPSRDEKAAIMSAFHDLPFCLDGNLDYVHRAADLVEAYLAATGHSEWGPELRAMTENHHKIRPYRGPDAPMVEAARRADWSDVLFGGLSLGIDPGYRREVAAAFPLTGFYPGPAWKLVARYAVGHLRRPLPNLRW